MHLRDFGNARLLEHGREVGNLPHAGAAAHHVVESEHAVRLAAAEGRLELDDGLAVEAAHAAQ